MLFAEPQIEQPGIRRNELGQFFENRQLIRGLSDLMQALHLRGQVPALLQEGLHLFGFMAQCGYLPVNPEEFDPGVDKSAGPPEAAKAQKDQKQYGGERKSS